MKTSDLINLFVLGALWGLSFLFIRVAALEFGPVALIELRVLLATLVLVPFLLRQRGMDEVLANWRPIALLGVLHYAIPFCLFAYAMLTLTGGYSAIINASSPMFAGAVAWILMGERLSTARILGLVVGFLGVAILVWDETTLNAASVAPASAAAVAASFCYGLAAVLVRKQLAGVSSTAISAGSMSVASLVLAPMTIICWPSESPSAVAWAAACSLGVFCTAIAFALYFRLIRSVGPTRAITVTFLSPVFAVLFGALFIGEAITAPMIAGGAVVLLGTAMATGIVDWSSKGQSTARTWSRQGGAPKALCKHSTSSYVSKERRHAWTK